MAFDRTRLCCWLCGYLTETHTYKCGISEDQNCCEAWGCGIQGVRRMASKAAEDAFLANLQGKSFKAFRWSLTPRSYHVETGGECGGAADVELILNSSTSSSGRDVVTFNLWCSHNGFYPHDVVIMRDEEEDTQSL